MEHQPLVLVNLNDEQESIAQALERAIRQPATPVSAPAALTSVAQGDPFLAEQLAQLRQTWELRPEPPDGLLSRIRTRLAWWLLEPELRQASQVHATLLRLCDSLVVLVDNERQARRRLEEHLAERSSGTERT